MKNPPVTTQQLYTELDEIEARAARFMRLGNIGKARSLKAEAEALQIRISYREREAELITPLPIT